MVDTVKLKINLPMIKMELSGSPDKHIPELRKFFAELRKLSSLALDSELVEEFPSFNIPFWKMSREVQKNDSVMELLSKVGQIENATLVRKVSVENISEITDKGSISRVNLPELRKSVRGLFEGIEKRGVNCVFVHVMGELKKEEFSMIVDQVMKQFPHARFEKMHSNQDALGKTLVECMVFGNLPEEN